MIESIKCLTCGAIARVNGQKMIERFGQAHLHGAKFQTGMNLRLNAPNDRMALKIEPKPLITGC